ncbi:MAG: hypothetical protein M3373_10185 [Gemmatimonadota bacterium]|nr:hypothetical protein [Gemmatimonadota bacterium]
MRHLALLVAAPAILLMACEDRPTSPDTERPSGTPVSAMITAQINFVSTTVTTGGAHTCALTSSGAAYCWGSNSSGQLGDGTANQCTYNVACSTIPVAVTGGLTFSRIAAGAAHTCAIATSGQTYCWGSNNLGQLGNGTTTQSRVPVLVAGGHSFTQISGGNAQTCAVTAAGAAHCWGY